MDKVDEWDKETESAVRSQGQVLFDDRDADDPKR